MENLALNKVGKKKKIELSPDGKMGLEFDDNGSNRGDGETI